MTTNANQIDEIELVRYGLGRVEEDAFQRSGYPDANLRDAIAAAAQEKGK